MKPAQITWMARRVRRALGIRRAFARVVHRWRAWSRFWQARDEYNLAARPEQRALLENLYPCVYDATDTTEIEPVYYFQDCWAFERIVADRPPTHVDVGSHHKYVALLSKVVPVTMVDIRPLSVHMDSLAFMEGSILKLPFHDGSVTSLSSLCVVEHIGLGRYGDAIDPDGSRKAILELKRVLAPGASLYVSVPVDNRSYVEFNAHRVFAESEFRGMVDDLELLDRRYIVGNQFLAERAGQPAVACFHLRRSIPDRGEDR